MDKIAVVGAGMVGRAWAVVFARARRKVSLFDVDKQALESAVTLISNAAKDLCRENLIDESPSMLTDRITATDIISDAVEGASYVQESVPEDLKLKEATFSELDRLVATNIPIGSSTSGFCASSFTEELDGRSRCLVVHPVNPPSVVPLVEIAPAPWTKTEIVDRVRILMNEIGQEPITVLKEIDGFILNRLQGALLNEAMRLIADGYVSTEDLDKTVKHGLGLRWSFMGPMETIDINAPGGVSDYSQRYGPIYFQVAMDAEPRPWDSRLFGKAAKDRRSILSLNDHMARQKWRDRRLMALLRHKREASVEIGD